jgi:hypothetical protein
MKFLWNMDFTKFLRRKFFYQGHWATFGICLPISFIGRKVCVGGEILVSRCLLAWVHICNYPFPEE